MKVVGRLRRWSSNSPFFSVELMDAQKVWCPGKKNNKTTNPLGMLWKGNILLGQSISFNLANVFTCEGKINLCI